MATTTKADDGTQAKERDVLGRLADRGEEALGKLADLPGGARALRAFNDLKTRVDEMGKKVRGIDALEARIVKLEAEVSGLKRASKAAAKPKASASKTAS